MIPLVLYFGFILLVCVGWFGVAAWASRSQPPRKRKPAAEEGTECSRA